MPIDVIDAEGLRRAMLDSEWLEAPVTDAISPLTAIEVSGALEVEVPPAASRLVVGVLRTENSAAPGLDVAVSSDEDLLALSDACEHNPRAVIALAQLLRTTERLDVESALVSESFAYSALLGGAEFARWRAAQTVRDHHPAKTPVIVDDDGDTLTITLNRPEVHNAYDAAMRDALVDILRAAYAMTPGRSIVLRGNGPSFCSGGDLTEFGTNDDAALAHLIRTVRAPGSLLHRLRERTAARVHGACIGAGTELSAFCRHVTARAETTFQLPEVSMGLVPGAGGTVSVTRRIGRQRTMWLTVTGAVIDAEVALRWGLVDALSA